jgi:hypothetical protein
MATRNTIWTPQLLDDYLAAGSPVEWVYSQLRRTFGDTDYDRAVSTNSIPQWILGSERDAASLEMALVAAGGSLYDELLKAVPADRSIRGVLESAECCVLLLDGLSLREIPEIVRRARETPGCSVTRVTWSLSSAPSDTVGFRRQRLQMGGANITQLATQMGQLGVTYRAHRSQPDILEPVSPTDRKVFVWSQFPDSTFGNDSARSIGHFTTTIVPGLRQVWNNVVMRLGRRKVLITSDHGYVLQDRSADSSLGPELWEVCPSWNPSQSDQKAYRQRFNQIFGSSRFVERSLAADELVEIPDNRIVRSFERDGQCYTAVVGRFFWHAGGSAFTHDGLSLLECIVPWVELEIA